MENGDYHMGRIRDLHNCKPDVPLPIKWVGVESISFIGKFQPQFEGDPNPVSMACTANLYSSLKKDQRAVHISRFIETLHKELATICRSTSQFCKEIAENIREVQKQDYGRVKLTCRHNVKRKTPMTNHYTTIPIVLTSDVIAGPKGCVYKSSLSCKTIITCPCGLEMTSIKSEKIFSHTQRATIKVVVVSTIEVMYSTLLKIIESVCFPLGTLLKRNDELKLIENSFKNPKFCEDVARDTLKLLEEQFKLSNERENIIKLLVSVKSNESIEPFSIVSYIEKEGLYKQDKVNTGNV